MVATLPTPVGPLHRYKQHLPGGWPGHAPGTVAGRKSTLALRTSPAGIGNRMDRGAKSAGQRAHRAAVRDPPGPPGEGNALGGNRHDGSSESLFGDALSSGVGAALHGGASQPAQCPSTAGSRTSPGRSPECAGGPQGDRRSHRELGRKPLGRAPGRSLRGTSRSAGRNRTATRWHALAALSRPLLASDALPERIAIGKSFRPTASRTCRSKPKTPREDQNQIPCGCQSPLEKALEEDISIWQKPGHFYFALTRTCHLTSPPQTSCHLEDPPIGSCCELSPGTQQHGKSLDNAMTRTRQVV